MILVGVAIENSKKNFENNQEFFKVFQVFEKEYLDLFGWAMIKMSTTGVKSAENSTIFFF